MDVEWDEWVALTQQNPCNLTEKGQTRLAELENKFGSMRGSQNEGHLETY